MRSWPRLGPRHPPGRDTRRGAAAIVVVCRGPGAREILGRELSKRYGADYQIVVCDRPAELETRMRDLLAAGLPVAMVIGGVGTQDRDGIEVLAAIRAIDVTALRVATVRWGDWESARSIFDAITLGKIDHWVTRPPRRERSGVRVLRLRPAAILIGARFTVGSQGCSRRRPGAAGSC